MFGEAIIHIENIRCDLEDNPGAQAPDCQEANIQGYPTWIINNNQYPGLQSFETLSKLSGCKL